MSFAKHFAGWLAASAALAICLPISSAAQASDCGTLTTCYEVSDFSATAVRILASLQANAKIVDVTVRFHNKTAAPLTLGFVSRSGMVADGDGNRYQVFNELAAIHGMGLVNGGYIDPKFVLAAGGRLDSTFEFQWNSTGREAFNSTFSLDMTIRSILPGASAAQHTLGEEVPIHFDGMSTSMPVPPPATAATTTAAKPAATTTTSTSGNTGTTAKTGSTTGSSTASRSGSSSSSQDKITGELTAGTSFLNAVRGTSNNSSKGGSGNSTGKASNSPNGGGNSPNGGGNSPNGGSRGSSSKSTKTTSAAVSGSPCPSTPSCFNAGPFTAQVVSLSVTPAAAGKPQQVHVRVRFTNTSQQAIVLAYKVGSGEATDNSGSTYSWGATGMADASADTIGNVAGTNADGKFSLDPGDSRSANFHLSLASGNGNGGNSYTWSAVISNLAALASGQFNTLQEYTISIPGLAVTPGAN